jgi:hypothetical protein
MTVLAVTAGGVVYLLVVAALGRAVIASVQRRAEREQIRHEQREKDLIDELATEREQNRVERTELLDRLHHALQKPWGYPPPPPQVDATGPPADDIVSDPSRVGVSVAYYPEEALS